MAMNAGALATKRADVQKAHFPTAVASPTIERAYCATAAAKASAMYD